MLTPRLMQQALADRLAGQAIPESLHLNQWVEPWATCWYALDNAPADTPPHTVLFRALAAHSDRDVIISTLFGLQPGETGQYPALYDLAQDLPPITWLWPGWIPRGMLTLFGAVPGVGKSLVALDLCRRLIHGEPFPDGTPAPASSGPIVYIDAEAVPQIIHARAASWEMDTRPLYLMLPEADALLDFGQVADRDRLVEMTYALRPALVIVDSLSSVTSKSENAIEDVRALLGFFSNLAREYSLALVLIHHARKRSATLGGAPVFTPITLDDFRGSGHIVAMARSVLGLSVVPDGPKPDSNGPRQLEVIKSNLARLPEPLGFTLDEIADEVDGVALRWGAAPEPWREPTKLDQCLTWLETLLRESDAPLSPKAVIAQAEEEGFSRAVVFRARKALGDSIRDTAGRRNPANAWEWGDPEPEPEPDPELDTQ